jgi:hypothetical protein
LESATTGVVPIRRTPLSTAGQARRRIDIVIADDSYIVREGVRRLLEDSREVVVQAAVGSDPNCSARRAGRVPMLC